MARKSITSRYPAICPACGKPWKAGQAIGRSYHGLGWVHGYCKGITTRSDARRKSKRKPLSC